MIKTCHECKADFETASKYHTHQRYCSKKCWSRGWSKENRTKSRQIKSKYEAQNVSAIKLYKKQYWKDNIKQLNEQYLKAKLRRQGANDPSQALIDLKRIHITLKRIRNGRKNEQSVNS
jgi:D-alanyl-D-alanine carboxypeptidase